jgi:hypothetical protein
MDLSHLSWPFFDSSCVEFAGNFERWVRAELGGFEQDEGGMAGRRGRYLNVSRPPAGCETPSRHKHSVSNARLAFAA